MMCEAKKCDPCKNGYYDQRRVRSDIAKKNGCSEECTAKCLSMYDAGWKKICGRKTQTIKLTTMKDVRVEMTNDNGKTKATVTTQPTELQLLKLSKELRKVTEIKKL